ncbi:MAG: methylenetetrahydrofolate reductase [NAD(P)H] [Pseudohongiellaceae bacterium]
MALNTFTADSSNFSFEFFPPRSAEGEEKLMRVHDELAQLDPGFFSVTYGAGGSTKQGTQQIVLKIAERGSNVAPHLSFGGSNEGEISDFLRRYRDAGINRLVALRGDIPSGTGRGQYRYANELIEFIRRDSGDYFHIEVACYPEIHPQSDCYESDIAYFKLKVDAGADSAITQYFYNADAYFYFVERCRAAGITLPIVPGIMPITNYVKLARFSSTCGAEIPRWIRQRLQGYGDDTESIRAFGEEVVTALCETLLRGGAPGLHFYTMNQSSAVKALWRNLGSL